MAISGILAFSGYTFQEFAMNPNQALWEKGDFTKYEEKRGVIGQGTWNHQKFENSGPRM
jgi:hypothetical protein